MRNRFSPSPARSSGPRRCIVGTIFAMLIGLVLAPATTVGDERFPLLIEFEQSTSINRSGGPVPVSLRVQWHGRPELINGNLSMEFRDGPELLAIHVLRDLYISAGEQRFEFLLPPPSSSIWQSQFDVFMTWSTATERHRLGEQQLRLPGAPRRTMVVLVGTRDDGLDRPVEAEYAQSFQLERLSPLKETDGTQSPVMTLVRTLSVRDFPTHPLSHCVQDLAVLTGDVFADLSEQQGRALLAWVRAGGSLCLLLDSVSLESWQVDLINEFLSTKSGAPAIGRSTTGKLLLPDDAPQPIKARCGLGRVVVADGREIVRGNHANDPDRPGVENPNGSDDISRDLFPSPEWRNAVAFLWKFREDQLRQVDIQGTWSEELTRRLEESTRGGHRHASQSYPGWRRATSLFRPQPISGGGVLIEHTLPQGMQVFPLWLMGATLLLYILAIGPGDYHTLGMFRARKFTWVLFPLLTVAFTGGAIAVSNALMAGRDHGGSVVITDVTEQGLIARETNLQQLFFASSRTTVTDLSQSLFTPLDSWLGGDSLLMHDDSSTRSGRTPIVEGMLPVGGQVIQSIAQWTPQLHRTFRIPREPRPEPSGFDWSAAADVATQNGTDALRGRLRAAFGDDVHAQALGLGYRHSDSRVVICGDRELLTGRDDPYNYHRSQQNFVLTSAWKEDPGLFSVVSRVSPKCDDFLEDVPLLDVSDPHQWLLIVVVRDDNNWRIYRRLYTMEDR